MLALRKSLRNWIVMIFRAFVCQTFQLQQQHQQWWWRASCARAPCFATTKPRTRARNTRLADQSAELSRTVC